MAAALPDDQADQPDQPDQPGEPQPAAETAATSPQRAVFDMDSLEMGDLEDMEEYAGQPILPLVRQMYVTLDETGGDLFAAVCTLPLKAISGLLGVARRQQDPTFTQDKWRTAKFADVFPRRSEAEGEEEGTPVPPEPATPIRSGQTKRRGNSRTGSKTDNASGKRVKRSDGSG